MKTRYWKDTTDGVVAWSLAPGGSVIYIPEGEPSCSSPEELDADPDVVECDANGTPLSQLPADRVTLAEFDAFAARVRAQLAKLEQEEAR